MDKKTEEFIRQRVEYMRILGLTDNESETEDYIDMMKLVIQEQDDKNNISDSKIEYNDEIVEIEELDDMETVDISVTGDQLFYCNGILTKNSIGVAATADVILSIFQSEEDQELGLIKLGMMKNRYGPRGMIQAMRIDYPTLTINQSDEDEESFDDDSMSLLERLAGE
jgi:hypothetical protein